MARPIPVPTEMLELHQKEGEARRQTILPPDGDMFNSEVRATEVLVTNPDTNPISDLPIVRQYFLLEDVDREAILQGKQVIFEYSIWGGHIHPYDGHTYEVENPHV